MPMTDVHTFRFFGLHVSQRDRFIVIEYLSEGCLRDVLVANKDEITTVDLLAM